MSGRTRDKVRGRGPTSRLGFLFLKLGMGEVLEQLLDLFGM
jgi:hypothetical protein